jgi:hypothetical protein
MTDRERFERLIATRFEEIHKEPGRPAIETIAVTMVGYRKAQNSGHFPLDFPRNMVEELTADDFVRRYLDKREASSPMKMTLRLPQMKQSVAALLDDRDDGTPAATEEVVDAVARLSLGSWPEDAENALRQFYAGLFSGWYLSGLA